MRALRHYEELEPSPALSPHVECFWWSDVQAPADCTHRHRVLPDGCVDILFDLREGRGSVIGAMTRALVVEASGPQRLLAVRFRPGGASPFFRLPLHEWTDQRVDLPDAWSGDEALGERLGGSDFPHDAARILDLELLRKLRLAPRMDRRIRLGLQWLWRQPALSIREAAARLGFTRQHLTRLCKATTGLGPKQIQRIARLQRALSTARGGQRSWARVALDAGYFDQAHLIGECRALTGLTPVQLQA